MFCASVRTQSEQNRTPSREHAPPGWDERGRDDREEARHPQTTPGTAAALDVAPRPDAAGRVRRPAGPAEGHRAPRPRAPVSRGASRRSSTSSATRSSAAATRRASGRSASRRGWRRPRASPTSSRCSSARDTCAATRTVRARSMSATSRRSELNGSRAKPKAARRALAVIDDAPRGDARCSSRWSGASPPAGRSWPSN